RLLRADLYTIADDFDVGIMGARAVGPGEHIGANIRGAFRKDDAGASGINGNVPLVAGDIPIEFVVILEKAERVGDGVLNGNRLRRIVGIRNVDFQFAVMAFTSAFVSEGASAGVGYPLHIQEERVVESL